MTTATLALLRDETLTIADLARHFGQSETWAAGALDAVDGGQDWRELFADSDVEPSEADRADYAAGFAFGLDALDGREQATDEPATDWSEYAAVACGAMDDSEVPW